MINIIDEKLPDDKETLTAKPVGFLKAGGMGFMKGAADIAGAAAIGIGGLQALNERGQEKTYKFYDEFVKPAKEYWTPDPSSTSMAGKIFGGISGLGPSLLLGPAAIPTLIGTSAINTGTELVEKEVNSETAVLASMASGLVSAAQIKLPASGKTIAQTLGLIALNPVMGAAQAGGIKTLLESGGYKKQAKDYDPFDPVGRSIDVVLGVFFGGMAHYQKGRGKLPVEAEDAIDTIAAHQKAIKDTPFESTLKSNRVNLQAKDKAMQDLSEGKPVDVSEQLRELRTRGNLIETPTLDALMTGFKEHVPNLKDAQIEATKVLIEKRAQREGLATDEYVNRYFAGITSGDATGKAQFFQNESIKYQISELFDYAGGKDNAIRKVSMGELSTAQVEAVKQATGHDLTGYRRIVDNYAIKHILNEHGDAKKEADRGLIPVTKEDILRIPDIVENPDNIIPAGKTRVGRDSILYEKRFNGVIFYLEEKRTGKNEIAAVTLYKKKAATSNAPDSASSVTPEAFRSLDDSNLPLSGESVNRLDQTINRQAKGAVQFLADGRAVIHAFEQADISTVIHELGHVFRRQIKGDDLGILEKWAGVKDGKWERIHEEDFAQGIEKYFSEGKAPSEELKGVFDQFKQWMVDIYRKVVGYTPSDVVRLSPEVRKVMDRLFVEAELPLRKTEHPETIETRKVADEAVRELNDETSRLINENIPKEITTVEDWGSGETYTAQKKKRQAKAEPILNEPVERSVESILAERDISYFKGTDAEGKAVHGSMMEHIDEAKAEYNKVKSLEDVFERIGLCIKNGG